MGTDINRRARQNRLNFCSIQQRIVATAPDDAQTCVQHIDQHRSIAIQAIQPHLNLGRQKLVRRRVPDKNQARPFQFLPVVSIATSPKRVNVIIKWALPQKWCSTMGYNCCMSSYLITGDSGSGKTSVIWELEKRGYTAYNTDDLPVTRLEDELGQPVDWPPPPVDWSKYGWNWQEMDIRELLDSDETVFVGALASNQDRFFSWFTKIFVLLVDTETLRHRILSRTDHDFGKDPQELQNTLERHARLQEELLAAPRAIAIDAQRSLDSVVGDIISAIQLGPSGEPQ